MPNTKEKIIELHKTLCASLHCNYDEFQNAMTIDALITAENLIANGATIPVRYKDCKHLGKDSCAFDTYAFECTADTFCSYGEKRGESQ